MALKATIFKAGVDIADLERGYYASHVLTLARHPSETDERMMVRLLAFVLHADERLEFGKGLSSTDEAALSLCDYGGQIRLWIEVGLPDERILRRAAGRADRVVVLAYGGRAAELWWAKDSAALGRLANLAVWSIAPEASAALAGLAKRTMNLQCTLQEGQVWLTDGEQSVMVEPRRLK